MPLIELQISILSLPSHRLKSTKTAHTSPQSTHQSPSLVQNDEPGKAECGSTEGHEERAVGASSNNMDLTSHNNFSLHSGSASSTTNTGLRVAGSTSGESMNLCPFCQNFCLNFIRVLNGKHPDGGLAYPHYTNLAGLELSVDKYGCRICFLLLQSLRDCGSKFSFLRHVETGSERGALLLTLNQYQFPQTNVDPFLDTWGLELLHFGNLPSAFPMVSLIPLASLGMSPPIAKSELFRVLISW